MVLKINSSVWSVMIFHRSLKVLKCPIHYIDIITIQFDADQFTGNYTIADTCVSDCVQYLENLIFCEKTSISEMFEKIVVSHDFHRFFKGSVSFVDSNIPKLECLSIRIYYVFYCVSITYTNV